MNGPETTDGQGVVLAYHRPPATGRPRPLWAILLGMPAAVCWLLLASFLFRRQILGPLRVPWFFLMRLGLLFWATAIVVGLFSVAYYWRKPKPWHVIACLVLNGSVLLATAALVLLLAFAQSRFN